MSFLPGPRLLALATLTVLRTAWADGLPCEEAGNEGFQPLYALDLPVNAAWTAGAPAPYVVDHSSTVPPFDRIGWYLELTRADGSRQWAWGSYEAAGETAEALRVPHEASSPAVRHRLIRELSVESNLTELNTQSFVDGGTLEVWPWATLPQDLLHAYAADSHFVKYDWSDRPNPDDGLYGSFQIHNAVARQPVICWSGFTSAGGTADDIGLGPGPVTAPDWQGSANAASFTSRRLEIWVRPRRFKVGVDAFPKYRQLVPRDRFTNLATVPVSGKESLGGWEQAVLRVLRDGVPDRPDAVLPLHYGADGAPFSIAPTIPAACSNFTFELFLRRSGESDRLVRRVGQVVAGDAFLVYGQSNAVASPRGGGSVAASGLGSPWVRAFGVTSPDLPKLLGSDYWNLASSDDYNFYAGNIGQWAGVIAGKLVAETGVPVAMVNGAVGGLPLSALLRDEANPAELSDAGRPRPYARMMHLAESAGLRTRVRGIFFYQGESDLDATAWRSSFATLRTTLREDCPALERLQVVQVLPQPGVLLSSLPLRDAQRRLAADYADVRVTTANGLSTADGVHLLFSTGYLPLGERSARLAAADFYARALEPAALAPDVRRVERIRPFGREWLLTWATPQSLTRLDALLPDLSLVASSGRITAAREVPAGLMLTVEGDAGEATALRFAGHDTSAPWAVNALGIPPLSFLEPVVGIPPEITLLPSLPTGIVGEEAIFRALAAPRSGGATLDRLEWLVDGVLVRTEAGPSGTLTGWAPPEAGQHTITARAWDADGYATDATATYRAVAARGPAGVNDGIDAWFSAWRPFAPGQDWTDASGRSHHLTSTASATGPRLDADAFGLAPALRFGVEDSLAAPFPWPAGAFDFVFFCDATDAAPGTLVQGGDWSLDLAADGYLLLRSGGSAVLRSGAALTGRLHPAVVELSVDPSTDTTTLKIDGAAASVTGFHADAGSWTLGGGFGGRLGEVALYRRLLSAIERTAIETQWRTLTGEIGTSYATWASATGNDSPLSDEDGDGLPAVLEYALGTHPGVPTPLGDLLRLESATADTVVARWRQPVGRTGVALRLEASDGGSWTAIPLPVASASGSWLSYSVSLPRTMSGHLFRLRATLTQP